MKFFKENSYDIVKLFVNQIGIAIFSMALYTAVSIAIPTDYSSAGIEFVLSVAATLFYLVLIYIAVWEMGAKDAIRIESGKMKRGKCKGLALGTLANLPNFILTGSALIFMGIHILAGTEWCTSVFAVLNLIFGFIESMYLGMIINIIPVIQDAPDCIQDVAFFWRTLAYFVAPILSLATTTIAYELGLRNKRIFAAFTPSARNVKK